MNKDLWAYGQYQSDTKIEEKVKVDSQGMASFTSRRGIRLAYSFPGPARGPVIQRGL